MESENCVACLTSPKTRFEFSTDVKKGDPGKAAEHKKKVIEESGKPPTVTTTEHKLEPVRDGKGNSNIVVTAAKIKPATASDIIASLPQVDGKKYKQGVPNNMISKTDPSSSEIPTQLVCNEYVYFSYGRAGEKIPYNLNDQIRYFQQQNRFTTDPSKGEVGDVAYFAGPPQHEVIIMEVRKEGKVNWYHYSGSHFHGGSGAFLSKGSKVYISQNGQPASLMNDKLIFWPDNSVRGYIELKGFGKAERK